MKPIFGIDCTENKKNDEMNLEQFLVQRPSSVMKQALDSAIESARNTDKQSKLPRVLTIAQWLCGAAAVLTIGGIVKALTKPDGPSISQAYNNAGFLFWIAGGCLILWTILKLLGMRKAKQVWEGEDAARMGAHLETAISGIYSELGVPEQAAEVDILTYYYKLKGEDAKPILKGMNNTCYLHLSFKLFSDGEKLYFANLDGKYSIPKSALGKLHKIDKRIAVINWTKDEEHTEGRYSAYKIKIDNNGYVYYKPYYKLELLLNGEPWCIEFPCYELPAFESVTGLKAE